MSMVRSIPRNEPIAPVGPGVSQPWQFLTGNVKTKAVQYAPDGTPVRDKKGQPALKDGPRVGFYFEQGKYPEMDAALAALQCRTISVWHNSAKAEGGGQYSASWYAEGLDVFFVTAGPALQGNFWDNFRAREANAAAGIGMRQEPREQGGQTKLISKLALWGFVRVLDPLEAFLEPEVIQVWTREEIHARLKSLLGRVNQETGEIWLTTEDARQMMKDGARRDPVSGVCYQTSEEFLAEHTAALEDGKLRYFSESATPGLPAEKVAFLEARTRQLETEYLTRVHRRLLRGEQGLLLCRFSVSSTGTDIWFRLLHEQQRLVKALDGRSELGASTDLVGMHEMACRLVPGPERNVGRVVAKDRSDPANGGLTAPVVAQYPPLDPVLAFRLAQYWRPDEVHEQAVDAFVEGRVPNMAEKFMSAEPFRPDGEWRRRSDSTLTLGIETERRLT